MKNKNGAASLIMKFAAPYKSRYIVSVVCAITGELKGMLPYFAAVSHEATFLQ